MRIGIDYTAAARQGAGIGRYTRNLVRAVADLDRQNEYLLWVAGGRVGLEAHDWPSNFHFRVVPLSDRWVSLLWQRLRLPLPVEWFTGRLDLFHSPDFVLPPTRPGARTMLTVHDLSFLRVPDCFVPAFRDYLAGAVCRAVCRADAVLADSESTRRDLTELLGVPARRITVLYPGVEARFRPVREQGELERVKARYGLPPDFVLGLGTLQPRKNFVGLVEAFARLEDPHLALVIAGGEGWLYEPILEAVERSGVGQRVHFLGFVDDADLPALYSLARVFAFPSWYEGFGLPALEAMACGTPVVVANNSSLPEVAGDAALLVEAGDWGALSAALERLLVDEPCRVHLVEAGRRQASKFTWEAGAQKLLECYQRVGQGAGR